VTSQAERYPFVERDPRLGVASLAPLLPVTLLGAKSISVSGLLDTGATVNVLPYAVGEQLGAVWEQQTTSMTLSGNLSACEARALIVSAVVGEFPAVRLAFAWARTDAVSVLLGQVNFFMEFDVCFYRSRCVFEVRSRQAVASP
jgi:Aspartyl protease